MPAWVGASEVRTELCRAGNPQWFGYVGLDLTIATRLGTTVVPRSGGLFASTASARCDPTACFGVDGED